MGDTAYEVLSAITAKDGGDYYLPERLSSTNISQGDGIETEMTTLHTEFTELAELVRERVRSCREMYETCRVYLECRDIQVNALKSSMLVLEKRRKYVLFSVSFLFSFTYLILVNYMISVFRSRRHSRSLWR